MAAAGASSAVSNNFSSIWHKILGAVWYDEGKNEPVWKGYLEEKSTDKKYFDDVELVDPGLWSETDEGTDIDLDDFGEGIRTRYEPKKFAKRLIIPEELQEDGQYEDAYDAARMLRRTEMLTEDYDAVGILNNAFDTSFVFGDSQPVCSASHPIRGGSTVSNLIGSTPLSPSNTAIAASLIVAEKMPGSNGFRLGVKALKVVCPTNQKFRFMEILQSGQKDDTANNAINAIKGELASTPVAVPFMTSTTNWFVKTDVKRGALFVFRRKPRFRRTSAIENETVTFTGSARWVTGVTNWRTFIGSQS